MLGFRSELGNPSVALFKILPNSQIPGSCSYLDIIRISYGLISKSFAVRVIRDDDLFLSCLSGH